MLFRSAPLLTLPLAALTALAACSSSDGDFGIDGNKKLDELTTDELVTACENSLNSNDLFVPTKAHTEGFCLVMLASSSAEVCEQASAECFEPEDVDDRDEPLCSRDDAQDQREDFAGCSASWGDYLECARAQNDALKKGFDGLDKVKTCSDAAAIVNKNSSQSPIQTAQPEACKRIAEQCPRLFDDADDMDDPDDFNDPDDFDDLTR